MPRTPITTTFTPRNKPSTEYKKPRDRSEFPISFDSVEITFDSTEYTWDETFRDVWPLTSIYETPRKAMYARDVMEKNIFDLSWEQVLWISGSKENKIVTIYT